MRSEAANDPISQGLLEYTQCDIALVGGLAKHLRETRQFSEVFNIHRCNAGILLTHRLIDSGEMESALF